MQKIEDVEQELMLCPMYQQLRQHMFDSLIDTFPGLSNLRGYQRNALFLRPDESGLNTGMIFSGMYISLA